MTEINSAIKDLLLQSRGIDISKFDPAFLDKSFQKRIVETHCISSEAYYAFLKQNDKEGEILSDSLNISYSEFFRDPLTFAVLERIILPSIAMKRKNATGNEIRIWSAACAAGQETYSLAILLEELKTIGNEAINFRIFATDQSESMVDEARKGQYSAAALNNLNLKRFNQWFIKAGDTFTIKQELKKNIDPPASIFGEFDLVICANLLFYYDPEYQDKILNKAGKCLTNNGYMVTGLTEREIFIRNNYREVFPQSAIFKR
jgi:chemotaxis protein methyltransferase CheR